MWILILTIMTTGSMYPTSIDSVSVLFANRALCEAAMYHYAEARIAPKVHTYAACFKSAEAPTKEQAKDGN